MKIDEIINTLVNIFDIDKAGRKPTAPLGSYIPKLNYIFQENIYNIKLDSDGTYLYHSKFKKHKKGDSNTWYYICQALYMFGIISNRDYDEENLIKNGIELEGVKGNDSFEEYLLSGYTREAILSNFQNDREWYKQKIFSMIWAYKNGEYGDLVALTKDQKKRKIQRYKGMFEAFAMVFTNTSYIFNSSDESRIKITRSEERAIRSEHESEVLVHRAMKEIVDKNVNAIMDDYLDEILPSVFKDGEVKTAFIRIRKRNKGLRTKALKLRGYKCEACGLNMKLMYGDLAVPHVHHKIPLYTMDNEVELTVDDVVVLCPTCHAAIHKVKEPFTTFREFKKCLEETKH